MQLNQCQGAFCQCSDSRENGEGKHINRRSINLVDVSVTEAALKIVYP